MNTLHRTLLAAVLSLGAAGAAHAGSPEARSAHRLRTDIARNVVQQQRIRQGVASGALTPGETARLELGQARVDHTEAHAAADGHVGPAEQAHIQSAENRQSRLIYRKKHHLRRE